ncbi:prolyl oligopeptidase family serine peptidase [Chitinophaga cymbidii]|uniref:prolyl oligopeptidase n=1 Tax=Chitinophaga cymbidii TaxID=1096750 RepID=A0A512RT35_9BACT|nr:prolyl oligopeptidase family serine peptidase [Chitinophaga cymbidii]GEP98857.1 prolyl endopeptidase [Chitinophaga cymbidii]
MSKFNHKHIVMSVMMTFTAGTMVAQQNASLTYPVARKVDTTDNYHGQIVADPYRWLEDDNSEETKAWVEAENRVTQDYLSAIPFRSKIKQRLEELWNYPKYGSPFREGKYYYFYKNDGLQNQAVLYRQTGLNGTPEVFIDPNKLSEKGTAALGSMSFSKDGKYVAYLVAKAGSDWQEGFVMDVETKQLLSDKLDWIKFSGLSWKGDGFYYSRYDAPDEDSKLSKKNEFHKVYFHKVGTAQADDQLVYVDKEHPLRNAGVGLTEDERFLILGTTEGTSGREVWYWDTKDAAQKEFRLLIKGFAFDPSVIENVGDHLLVRTNHDAPNYKVVLIDPKHPEKENWKTVIPEQPEVLQGVGTAGGKLFASYLKDASTRIVQYDMKGKMERNIALPGIGTAGGFGGKAEDREFFYTFTSFVAPPTIYKYDIPTGQSTLFRKTEVKFNPADYETKQVFFTSKDGTKVPIFLSYKKGLRLNGQNPVLLYGYGGFNIPMTPGFSVSNLFFMEQGGIYAVVNLRGGSEYGEAWHKAGMLDKKQNVFDDFIGAAEFLVREKYTSPQKLAIRGGSNGGLLVGACMTQRPELFKVALPAVGVMDMLRYQKFTIGWAWVVEYGSSEKAEQFPYLIKYSPLHNLKKGTHYPATLVTTADHDDRVVPAHSFKFAATLQEAHQGSNPVLIRVETQAGHGAGKPTSKLIDEATDIWAFTMYNLGMTM